MWNFCLCIKKEEKNDKNDERTVSPKVEKRSNSFESNGSNGSNKSNRSSLKSPSTLSDSTRHKMSFDSGQDSPPTIDSSIYSNKHYSEQLLTAFNYLLISPPDKRKFILQRTNSIISDISTKSYEDNPFTIDENSIIT